MLEMKIFILIVTVTFLSLIDFNGADPCPIPIATDCLSKPKRSNIETIQVGILYAASTPKDKVATLLQYICAVQMKLPMYTVSIIKMVGATVTIDDNGIECDNQNCTPDRREACRLSYGAMSTACVADNPPEDYIEWCLNSGIPNVSLVYASNLRCGLGIDVAKLPVVVIDQAYYDPCATFDSDADLLAFVCSFYYNLDGCPQN